MYTVEFIRAGNHGKHYNMKARGAFTKRFRTLSEIAGYVTSSTDLMFAKPIGEWEGFTERERHILKKKLIAIPAKRYTNHIRDTLRSIYGADMRDAEIIKRYCDEHRIAVTPHIIQMLCK